MTLNLRISPPERFETFSPSELFRYFFQLGHWTEETFSSDLQEYARGKSVSTVTISKWKNKNVIPTHYTAAFFKLIEGKFEIQIADQWIIAFETVWAVHAARQTSITGTDIAMDTKTTASDRVRQKHAAWIQSRYAAPTLGETFSTADIYVPLQMVEDSHDAYILYDPKDLECYARVGWEIEPEVDWTFVSGGPGSGKSMTALHVANTLSKSDVFSIYIRVTKLSSVDISLSDGSVALTDDVSISSFLKCFRSSSFATCSIILDGLDEIGGTVSESLTGLRDLVSHLKSEQDICRSNNKRLRVIAFGRSARTEAISETLPREQTKLLRMVGLNGQTVEQGTIEIVGEDFRCTWWRRYIAAKELSANIEAPEFLSTDYNDFFDFGTTPLLAYLLCRVAFPIEEKPTANLPGNEAIDQITYTKNKNTIYQAIIEQVRRENIWRTQSLKNTPLSAGDFQTLLQHIALLNWQNENEHPITIDQIENTLSSKRAKNIFNSLSFSKATLDNQPTDNITTVFDYDAGPSAGQNTLSFTHKSFADYLLSTLLFETFISLITTFTNDGDTELALSEWMKMSDASEQDPSLADFCEYEAKLKYDDLANLNWDAALKLLKAPILGTTQNTSKKKSLGDQVNQLKLASSLIFLIWNCLNRERCRRENIKFEISPSDSEFSITDLCQIHTLNRPRSKTNLTPNAQASNRSFLGHSLAGLHVVDSDMSHVVLNTGHIQNSAFENTSFAMNSWSHIRVENSTFKTSKFQHTSFFLSDISKSIYQECLFQWSHLDRVRFTKTRIIDTHFLQCHFSEVDLRDCHLQNVIFNRCIFVGSIFDLDVNSENGPRFRHCSFLNMQSAFSRIPKTLLDSCLQDAEPE